MIENSHFDNITEKAKQLKETFEDGHRGHRGRAKLTIWIYTRTF